MTTTKRTLSNSAASVDFNKEVAGLLSNTAASNGRELKLATAIYNSPASFAVSDLLNFADKKRAENMRNALAKHSPAFADKLKAADAYAKKAKGKDDNAFRAKAESQAANAVIKAAVAMFERALVSAYALRAMSAVVVKLDDKMVTVRIGASVTIGDTEFEAGATSKLVRRDLHELGVAHARAKGVLKASAGTTKPKVGNTGVDVKAATSLATIAGELSKSVGALTDKAADEFAASEGTSALFVAMTRKLFTADDGAIHVSDIVDALRKAGGFGVVIDVKPEPVRKSKAA